MDLAKCILDFPKMHTKWNNMIDLQQKELERLSLCNLHREFSVLLMKKQRFEYEKQKELSHTSFIEYCKKMSHYTSERIQYVDNLSKMCCEDLLSMSNPL